MDKFFDLFYGFVKAKDYKGIFKLITGMFSIFAPSFSVIFVYKRELFYDLDIVKFLLLCIVVNILILIIIAGITFAFRGYKYLIYLTDAINVLKKNQQEEVTFYKEFNVYAMAATDIIINMFFISIAPWINFYVYYISEGKVILEVKNVIVSIFCVMFLYGITQLINACTQTKAYAFRKDCIIYNLLCEGSIIIFLLMTVIISK